jgi:hypothetical protein
VIPFTPGRVRNEVRAAVEPLGARFVEMRGPTSYFDLFESQWTGERDLILLEQDVLPARSILREMAACTVAEGWCSGLFAEPGGHKVQPARYHLFPFTAAPRSTPQPALRIGGRPYWTTALGLNRFSAELQRRVPDLMARVARLAPDRTWAYLDHAIFQVLGDEERIPTHGHLPAVVHLHAEHEPRAARITGNLEASLRRMESSFAMASVARNGVMLVDSRTGERRPGVLDPRLACPARVVRADDVVSA